MPVYAMSRAFLNGKVAKKPIVYFEASSREEAYAAFGAGRYWSGYSENTGFDAQIVTEVPKNRDVISAARVIYLNREEE